MWPGANLPVDPERPVSQLSSLGYINSPACSMVDLLKLLVQRTQCLSVASYYSIDYCTISNCQDSFMKQHTLRAIESNLTKGHRRIVLRGDSNHFTDVFVLVMISPELVKLMICREQTTSVMRPAERCQWRQEP